MTEGPWTNLPESEARRVDSKGKHDFFWVRMPDNTPALLLQLAADTAEVRPLPKLRHLGVFYRMIDGHNCYCIALKDRAHLDIFETLCRDVINAAEQAEDLQNALSRAVRRTLRWHHLLRGESSTGLSLEEQRGLVAELSFLRDLVDKTGPLKAVEAWKGPEESAKDFELPGLYFEIKARRSAAHPKVQISSAAQLMDIDGAKLFLRVQDVDTSLNTEGKNLAEHVDATAQLFIDDIAALDIWEQRLSETRYSPETIEPERKWHLGEVKTFEVTDGFPRLVPPLMAGVDDVKYTIQFDACGAFTRTNDLGVLISGASTNV